MTDKIDIDALIERLEYRRTTLTENAMHLHGHHKRLLVATRVEIFEAIAALTEMKAREDVADYLKISDSDAALIRGLLDVTDIWDNHDKAIDRMLSCFPNDPLNKTNHKGDEL